MHIQALYDYDLIIYWDKSNPQLRLGSTGYKRNGVLGVEIKPFTPLTTASDDTSDIALRPTPIDPQWEEGV